MNRTPASGCAYLVVALIPMKDQKVASKPFLCPVEQPSCTISPYRSIYRCAATFSQDDMRRSLRSLSYGTNPWERSFGKRASKPGGRAWRIGSRAPRRTSLRRRRQVCPVQALALVRPYFVPVSSLRGASFGRTIGAYAICSRFFEAPSTRGTPLPFGKGVPVIRRVPGPTGPPNAA